MEASWLSDLVRMCVAAFICNSLLDSLWQSLIVEWSLSFVQLKDQLADKIDLSMVFSAFDSDQLEKISRQHLKEHRVRVY